MLSLKGDVGKEKSKTKRRGDKVLGPLSNRFPTSGGLEEVLLDKLERKERIGRNLVIILATDTTIHYRKGSGTSEKETFEKKNKEPNHFRPFNYSYTRKHPPVSNRGGVFWGSRKATTPKPKTAALLL